MHIANLGRERAVVAEDPGRRQLYRQVGHRWSLEAAEDSGGDAPATTLVMIGRRGATSSDGLIDLLEAVPPPGAAG